MKRVFAHLGFSAAVMLLILNFFSVTFAYIALGVVLAALCLVRSLYALEFHLYLLSPHLLKLCFD